MFDKNVTKWDKDNGIIYSSSACFLVLGYNLINSPLCIDTEFGIQKGMNYDFQKIRPQKRQFHPH